MTAIGTTPVFSASQFVAVYNQAVEMMFPIVGVVGELSNFRISKGRWVYLDLKDSEACVKFFGTNQQLPGPLEDGMNLEIFGRPYLHPRFGFSIQIMSIRPVGKGTIKKAQELLHAKLKSEGLFDDSRKRFIPYPPEKIAMITSGESAGYSDFIKVISKRWPRLEIKLFDVQVQGQAAAGQIVAAIEKCNQSTQLFDAVVLLRGGGSSDDLASFSLEPVVRAVAASRIPTLAAIGHERDVSLAELAADMHASTPSNAAELLVPDIQHERTAVAKVHKELSSIIRGIIKTLEEEIIRSCDMLNGNVSTIISHNRDFLRTSESLLNALDPLKPLKKGYAIVQDINGSAVKTARKAVTLEELSIKFQDGKITARPLNDE